MKAGRRSGALFLERAGNGFLLVQLGNPVAVNQQETVTCTPCTDGTGTAANQVTWTSTNITGAPVWSFSIATTASICQRWQEPLSTPLKSTAAGTAVTLVSPAAYAMRVWAFASAAVVGRAGN
jgi:hypothetical protein